MLWILDSLHVLGSFCEFVKQWLVQPAILKGLGTSSMYGKPLRGDSHLCKKIFATKDVKNQERYAHIQVPVVNDTPLRHSVLEKEQWVGALGSLAIQFSYFYYSDNAISYTEYIMEYNIMAQQVGLQCHSKTSIDVRLQ